MQNLPILNVRGILKALTQFAMLSGICSWSTMSLTAAEMQRIAVAQDSIGFVFFGNQTPFRPWGFNYDHDREGRLIEDYWDDDWEVIEQDFTEMKNLGANLVRIHLQYAKFMTSTTEANRHSLNQLARLLEVAEKNHIYLDITGLGCYHKQDVPVWYDKLAESERWETQAVFWESVAGVCKDSPVVFCYDLMNEPVVAGGTKPATDWLGPGFGDKYFVQRITLDLAGRDRAAVGKSWIDKLTSRLRQVDSNHLITVGLVDWSLDRPGLTSGFVPDKVAESLDFIAVHIYPESGKADEAMSKLEGFNIGKPVVVEETFPLKANAAELEQFISRSTQENLANGWIGFYWGQTKSEYAEQKTISAAITMQWLELFERLAGPMTSAAP